MSSWRRIMGRAGAVVPTAGVIISGCGTTTEPDLPVEIPTAIAFDSDRSGNRDVFVLWTDGRVTQVTDHPARDAHPDWSPDGGSILFHSDREGDFDAWVMKADGSDPRNLTIGVDGDQGFAVWSPYGTRIAYHSMQGGVTRDAAEDGVSAWAPNGEWIAYSWVRPGSDSEVYLIRPDGSECTNLTRHGAFNTWPDWRPLR